MNFISHIFSRNAVDLEKRAAVVRYDPQIIPSFVSQGIINVYFWLKSRILASLVFGNMIFFFFKKIFIYLAVSGLSCIMWGLSMWHTDSVVVARGLRHMVLLAPQHVGSQFPHQRLNSCPMHCKGDLFLPLDHQASPEV